MKSYRENPDGEENQRATRQMEREVGGLKLAATLELGAARSYGDGINLDKQISASLRHLTAIHDLRSALLEIINQQPCIEGGGCFYPMHDGEGNYIGQNHIDPIGVIHGMVETANRALEPNPNV